MCSLYASCFNYGCWQKIRLYCYVQYIMVLVLVFGNITGTRTITGTCNGTSTGSAASIFKRIDNYGDGWMSWQSLKISLIIELYP